MRLQAMPAYKSSRALAFTSSFMRPRNKIEEEVVSPAGSSGDLEPKSERMDSNFSVLAKSGVE